MKPKDLPQGTAQRGARTRRLQPSTRMLGATSAEVSVRQHQRSHQGPEVEQEPSPAGADLHPHSGPGSPRAPAKSSPDEEGAEDEDYEPHDARGIPPGCQWLGGCR
uniref:Uncharacterized protein n=1 Tax=Melopsittacus undulatus TaxID=13146 RepID=A0A8V5GEW2_MELUD